ncbi:MAG: glutamate racemase [Chromatiales bacterium]|nr:glutamate racemase [Chromatiales bacterium]
MNDPDEGPIGVFDSGVGGLSVWREIVRALPHEDTIYFADQVHVPYGPRGEIEIRGFCDVIARYLLDRGCKALVVACNTASAAALKHLRDTLPGIPTIGMEPAVKPAVALTKNGVVGIMATPATFQGRLFQATAGRHATGIRLVNQVCDGLAEHVEAGDLGGPDTEALLRRCLAPILEAGADTIVLACSHYPFVIDTIRRIAGPGVAVIDPAPAIARHLGDVLARHGLSGREPRPGEHRFVTSGDPGRFSAALARLAGVQSPVEAVRWSSGALRPAGPPGPGRSGQLRPGGRRPRRRGRGSG